MAVCGCAVGLRGRTGSRRESWNRPPGLCPLNEWIRLCPRRKSVARKPARGRKKRFRGLGSSSSSSSSLPASLHGVGYGGGGPGDGGDVDGDSGGYYGDGDGDGSAYAHGGQGGGEAEGAVGGYEGGSGGSGGFGGGGEEYYEDEDDIFKLSSERQLERQFGGSYTGLSEDGGSGGSGGDPQQAQQFYMDPSYMGQQRPSPIGEQGFSPEYRAEEALQNPHVVKLLQLANYGSVSLVFLMMLFRVQVHLEHAAVIATVSQIGG